MSAQINVAIRADAGHAIGTGHFGRAAAVAQAMGAYDDLRIVLVTTESAAPLVSQYFPDLTDAVLLPAEAASAADALAALRSRGTPADAVYLDHYGAVAEWEEATAAAHVPLLVLDDLGAARDAALIVRPVPTDAAETGQGVVLAGPAYLPLTRHITARRPDKVAAADTALRVNVCFGGSDPTAETLKALAALAPLDQIKADIVIGPGTNFTPTTLAPYRALPHLTFHDAPSQEQTATLLQRADLALGAGGVMQWERLCLGVPSLVVTVADNQHPQVRWMQAQGAIRWLGDHAAVTVDMMRDAITEVSGDKATRNTMARKGMALVDGRGAIRVAAALRGLCLHLRPVAPEDAQDLFDWRTDPRNWQFNLASDARPAFAAHVDWLRAKLADPGCMFSIVMQGDDPVGVVRFDIAVDGLSAALSIYLVPTQHGRKLGLPVYMAAERALRIAHPAVAAVTSHIHADNRASRRLHVDAGFVLSQSSERPDWLEAHRVFQGPPK